MLVFDQGIPVLQVTLGAAEKCEIRERIESDWMEPGDVLVDLCDLLIKNGALPSKNEARKRDGKMRINFDFPEGTSTFRVMTTRELFIRKSFFDEEGSSFSRMAGATFALPIGTRIVIKNFHREIVISAEDGVESELSS